MSYSLFTVLPPPFHRPFTVLAQPCTVLSPPFHRGSAAAADPGVDDHLPDLPTVRRPLRGACDCTCCVRLSTAFPLPLPFHCLSTAFPLPFNCLSTVLSLPFLDIVSAAPARARLCCVCPSALASCHACLLLRSLLHDLIHAVGISPLSLRHGLRAHSDTHLPWHSLTPSPPALPGILPPVISPHLPFCHACLRASAAPVCALRLLKRAIPRHCQVETTENFCCACLCTAAF